MTGVKPTTWKIDAHTEAKHQILAGYLKAWFPILSKYEQRIVYLDGFAGPGIYEGGEDGSPIIAIKTALTHDLQDKFNEITFLFIEDRKDRVESLKNIIDNHRSKLPNKFTVYVEGAEFAPTLEKLLDDIKAKGSALAPTFAFIDPFGFLGIPMKLIARLMANSKTEVLITFMDGFVNRFTDELRGDTLDELFGTSKWREFNKLSDPDARSHFLIDLYCEQLRSVAGAKYILKFAMRDKSNRHLYHLVFGTKNIKGLEVMKAAMFAVGKGGTYKFSDRIDAGQYHLIDYFDEDAWIADAAETVYKKFKGTTQSVEKVEEFVLVETSYIFRKSILKHLECLNPPKILRVTGRKKGGTFPELCLITFAS